jgi:hypothetical protein
MRSVSIFRGTSTRWESRFPSTCRNMVISGSRRHPLYRYSTSRDPSRFSATSARPRCLHPCCWNSCFVAGRATFPRVLKSIDAVLIQSSACPVISPKGVTVRIDVPFRFAICGVLTCRLRPPLQSLFTISHSKVAQIRVPFPSNTISEVVRDLVPSTVINTSNAFDPQ